MAHLMLDYDDRQVFEHVIAQAARVDATNFIVEFGSSEAKVGINLSENDLLTVLQREASKTTQHLPARWMYVQAYRIHAWC
jgi:predicted acetyltransferase